MSADPKTPLDGFVERHVANIDAYLELQADRDRYLALARDLAKTLDGYAHKALYKRCREVGFVP